MNKVIGILTGTTLVAATLWFVQTGETTKTVSAQTEAGSEAQSAPPKRRFGLGRLLGFNKRNQAPAPAKTGSSGNTYERHARSLMAQARDKAVRHQYDEAIRLAQQADIYARKAAETGPIAWQAGEQRPGELVAELQKRKNGEPTANGDRPFNPLAAAPTGNQFAASQPGQSPKSSTAISRRSPIQQVGGKENEKPAASRADFARFAAQQENRQPTAPPQNVEIDPKSTFKQQSNALLASARQDIAVGQFDSARAKAIEAQKIDVPYLVTDDRPEFVLAEIEQKTGAQTVLPNRPAQESSKPIIQSRDTTAISANAAQSRKQEADRLLREARQHLAANELAEAKAKALAAEELDVAYTIFDDRPQLVLSDVNRSMSSGNFASATRKSQPTETTIAQPPAGSSPKQIAQSLLAQARQELKAGNVARARKLAEEAGKYDVTYNLLDERPDTVLADIKRIERSQGSNPKQELLQSGIAQPKPQPANSGSVAKEQVKQLLVEAREDLSAGRLEAARQKAQLASQSDVTYGVFDDRPEMILSEIERINTSAVASNSPQQTFERGSVTQKAGASIKPDPAVAKKQEALALLKQSRNALRAGKLDEAEALATKADGLKADFDVFDDQPVLALRDIQQARRAANGQTSQNIDPTVAEANPFRVNLTPKPPVPAAGPTHKIPIGPGTTADAMQPKRTITKHLPVVPAGGMSALDWYQQGMDSLVQRDRDAAYQAFLNAYRSGERLDAVRTQRLQDFLRDLAPRGERGIQLTSSELSVRSQQSPIDIVEQKQKLRFERLRSEVLNAVFRAERLKDRNPEVALEIVDEAMASIETTELDDEMVAPLVDSLRKTRSGVETYMKRMQPIVDAKLHKQEVEESMRQEMDFKIRVEQEFASLVEEYNKLFRQRQFANAELVAKQAKELDPENPVAVNMEWKAKFARRNDINNRIKSDKEEGFWEALREVDEASVPHYGAPMQFGENWPEINKRRKGKYGPDNRTRTEEEQRIEKSLSRQISLHFEDAPLKDVIKHVATVADVNVVLDSLGLEEEGITTDTPVTISVDGIMLKSALNLLLRPKNLAFTIEDEVLKITSRLRQQGRLVVATYPVADLVVPIPNFAPSSGTLMGNPQAAGSSGVLGGGPGAQFSVPGMGAPQGQFQVGDPINGGNGALPWMDPPKAELSGGGAAINFDHISDLIISTVEPDTWQEVGGPGSVRGFETTLSLVIRQTQQVHDEIADLLSQLRRLQDLQVTIEVRFITVSDVFFERIGVDFDFNIQDNVGGPQVDNLGTALPPFGAVDTSFGAMAGAMAGMGMAPAPLGGGGEEGLMGFGGIGGASGARYMIAETLPQQVAMAGMAMGGMAMAGAAMAGGTGFFDPAPIRNLVARDNYPSGGSIIGLTQPGQFTDDLDIQFRQGSFQVGVPQFGNFNPDAGIQMGLAILSDIETFFFIQAVQGDERSNIMFSPKVTLFNGQTANIVDAVARPFVTSVTPTVGQFSVGFQPQITLLLEGVTMSVQAVISADRRFVRLSVVPNFTAITDVQTFTVQSGGGGGMMMGGMMMGGGMMGGGMMGGGMMGGGMMGGGMMGGVPFGGGGEQGLAHGFGSPGAGGIAMTGFGSVPGQRDDGQMGLSGIGGVGGGGAGGVVPVAQQATPTITIQQPIQEIVTVTTTVSVPDGGTVLLGGVKRLREGRTMSGVPILNKIPYVNRLFKNSGVGRETESLMLMVTPRIIIQEEEEELLGLPLD